MSNKPVAWMQHHYETGKVTKFSPVKVWEDDIPLYLHPAKTLTNGMDLLEKYADKLEDERPNKGFSDVVYDCIEILRKAQENVK